MWRDIALCCGEGKVDERRGPGICLHWGPRSFCVLGILCGSACLCRDCRFRGPGKASCQESEDRLSRFGAANPNNWGNEFRGDASRANFRGVLIKMLLATVTEKKIWLKVVSKIQGLYWPQTISVFARNLIFCLFAAYNTDFIPYGGSMAARSFLLMSKEQNSTPLPQQSQAGVLRSCLSRPLRSQVHLWMNDWPED